MHPLNNSAALKRDTAGFTHGFGQTNGSGCSGCILGEKKKISEPIQVKELICWEKTGRSHKKKHLGWICSYRIRQTTLLIPFVGSARFKLPVGVK